LGTVTIQEQGGVTKLEMYGQAVVPGSASLESYSRCRSLVFYYQRSSSGLSAGRCRIDLTLDHDTGLWNGWLMVNGKNEARVSVVSMQEGCVSWVK